LAPDLASRIHQNHVPNRPKLITITCFNHSLYSLNITHNSTLHFTFTNHSDYKNAQKNLKFLNPHTSQTPIYNYQPKQQFGAIENNRDTHVSATQKADQTRKHENSGTVLRISTQRIQRATGATTRLIDAEVCFRAADHRPFNSRESISARRSMLHWVEVWTLGIRGIFKRLEWKWVCGKF
jgi:hypothetical protein